MKVNQAARVAAGEQRRARTREALIDAAMGVIAQKGADGASIDDFVVAAGVSRGTFYNHFPAFDDLIFAVASRATEALDRYLTKVCDGVVDPAERLCRASLGFLDLVQGDAVYGWVMLRLETSSAPQQPLIRSRFSEDFQAGVAAGRFRPVDEEAARSLMVGSMRMAARSILSGVAAPDVGATVVELALTGLGVDPGEARRLCQTAVAGR